MKFKQETEDDGSGPLPATSASINDCDDANSAEHLHN